MALETFSVGQAETGDSIRRLLAKILSVFTTSPVLSPTAEITAIASGTYTTNQATAYIPVGRYKGLIVHVTCTAITGGASVIVQAQMPAAGSVSSFGSISSFTTTGTRTLVITPGANNAPSGGNASACPLSDQFRLVAIVTPAAGNATFSVSYQLIP